MAILSQCNYCTARGFRDVAAASHPPRLCKIEQVAGTRESIVMIYNKGEEPTIGKHLVWRGVIPPSCECDLEEDTIIYVSRKGKD